MSIVTSSIDDRHFIYELPAEQHNFEPGGNRLSFEVFVLAAVTQEKNCCSLANTNQDRALHAINSVWAKILKVS